MASAASRVARAGSLGALLVAMAFGAGGCAGGVARPAPPDPLFVDAAPRLGEDVSVRGVLRWEAQSRELVPAGAPSHDLFPRPCLPILIPLGDTALADAATRLNGGLVRVEGVIVDAVPRGLVPTKGCQAVGLRVATLRAEK